MFSDREFKEKKKRNSPSHTALRNEAHSNTTDTNITITRTFYMTKVLKLTYESNTDKFQARAWMFIYCMLSDHLYSVALILTCFTLNLSIGLIKFPEYKLPSISKQV